MNKNYTWNSDISEELKRFILEKQATGYKYQSQEKYLNRFDTYYEENGYTGIRFTKPMLDEFIYTTGEKLSTYYLKERLLRDVANYLITHGYREIYIPKVVSAPAKRCAHIPYIFTEKEMKKIFIAIDTWEDSFYTNRTLIDPVLFRLLYGTGLRISEALNLMVQDFDSVNGIITVYHAKNNKDRLVPIAPSITKRINVMVEQMHKYSNDTDYLFATLKQGRMDSSTVYRRFRQYLLRSEIGHGKSGPRVHDLRHNFAVKCLKRWVLSGNELTNMLPYLAAYMGHSDFRGTQYYLRLTADLYPDIVKRFEIEFGYIIPEGGTLYEGD